MATKVTLRQKAISGNRHSLYLDYYPAITHPVTKKPTRREFLGLYLIDKPKNSLERQTNKEIRELAENVRSKRQNEIASRDFGFLNINKRIDFIAFFKQTIEAKKESSKNSWQGALNHLIDFAGSELPVSNLNDNFCNKFKKYLLNAKHRYKQTPISQQTARCYLAFFKAVLSEAYKEGLIDKKLSIEDISKPSTQREFLTLEELNKLVKTPCDNDTLRRASIFSALTGLRWSDIKKMTWREVQHSNQEGYFLKFKQQKTQSEEVLPISKQAFNLLGEPKEPDQKVFNGLISQSRLTDKLSYWVLKAGINKKITFHCFRHTFATLQLSHGTDIYTVSKMLGHKDLQTTQIYAKIIDKAKSEAANRIELDM